MMNAPWFDRQVASALSRTSSPPIAKGTPNGVPFAIGGDEENRTPVRKPIHTTFFVDSLLFKIPLGEREQTRFPLG